MSINERYTGELTIDSAPQRRTVTGATITKISLGPMDNNAYLIVCTATGSALLIDAANDSARLTQLIDEQVPALDMIVTTHQHADHWQALTDIANGTGSPTAAHILDAKVLPVHPDRLLNDGDLLDIGKLSFRIIHLPGHTVGSIALALTVGTDTHLFSGDSLFPGGVGKTTSPEEFISLLDAVTNKIFSVYPDNTFVYPGHGKDTTLGAERPNLSQWRERGW
ncbi:MAG: MBL fold metallo-hydrolase [Mycobacteriaceae bacterium]